MKTATFLFILLLPISCFAQKAEDLKKFESLFADKSPRNRWGDQLKNNKNELSFVFSATFVLYKEVISSQDIDACVFTPSCSVYAIESIKHNGAVKGFFLAIDRLTRCNPSRNKNMPVDPVTGKFYDPVE